MLRVAFFDVDGTVTSHDSYLYLARRGFGMRPWRLALLLPFLPIFPLTLLFKLDRRWAKSAVLWALTCGMGKRAALRWLSAQARSMAQDLWFKEAAAEIRRRQEEGLHVCFVSASGQAWLRPLLKAAGPAPFSVIGSRLCWRLGGIVWAGPNCYGEEKLRRIEARFREPLEWVAGYSDHPADLPLLARCRERFLVRPSPRGLARLRAALGPATPVLAWTSSTHECHGSR